MNIGLIGCGSIGSALLKAIQEGQAGDASRVAIIADLPAQEARLAELAAACGCRYTVEPDSLRSMGLDLIIEGAGPAVVRAHAVPILEGGTDLLAMSVGALADAALLDDLWRVTRATGRRVYLPSGALGGIDAIRSARLAGLDEVTLTTRKPPAALKGAPWFIEHPVNLDELRAPAIIYDGTAADAIRWFPANVNVAVTLSLAGIGPERTRVRVVADPGLSVNVHEVYARGAFGELEVVTRNVPSAANPKTSYLAILSALATVRKITEPLQIGG